jgi:hypothetical protein
MLKVIVCFFFLKTGFNVHVVESLDCNWMDKKLGHEVTNKGRTGITGNKYIFQCV